RYVVPLPGRAPLVLGERTLVMGVINVTPDSFADGGLRFDPSRAIDDGWRMLQDGADILDIGGESTRPGADALAAAEEPRRARRAGGARHLQHRRRSAAPGPRAAGRRRRASARAAGG